MNTLRSHIRKVLLESYEDSISEAKKPLRRVAGALIKDVTTDKVLLLKRSDNTPRWAMMTGEVDEGEGVLDGLEREMYEELFIRPGSVRLNFMGVEHIPAKNIDLYYFEGFVKNQFKPHLDEENLDYGWFSLDDLPSPLFGGLYNKIEHLLQKENVYSDVKQIDEEVINEYITNNEVYLRDYLSMTEESKKESLPHEYNYFFQDFLEEEDIEFETPKETVPSNYEDEPFEEVDMFDNDTELIIWLEKNNRELYSAFADYLYKKITHNELPIPDSEYPAWSYFDDSTSIVKNQWLIHFTDDAEGIASNGFKYGVDDMSKLGLTTKLGDFDKKYGGYNFAYLLSDFPKYARGGSGYKYGKEAVVFRASGIKTWHYGDEEPQVIFYGNTATNIIPITEGDNSSWSIRGKGDRILFEDDELEKVVLWLTKNYNQYRKQLSEETLRKSSYFIRKEVRNVLTDIINEKFSITQDVLQITEPYDAIQKHTIGNKVVYALFGDVDYYQNKESIKAIKRKSDEVDLDSDSYKSFLQEFKRRFYSIPELRNSDVVVSIDTTSVVTSEMAEVIGKSYINSGFKKQDTMFKMQDIDLNKRLDISGIFNKSFDHLGEEKICVIDDFITTGTSFKNAFDTLPSDVEAVGVCLFRLKS